MPFSHVSPEGKLDHESATAELGRFLDTTLPSARLELTYRVERPEASAADDELETPEIVVVFDGADRGLLLDRGAELLKALEYIAVRWLRLEPQFHDRVRFDCGDYRANRMMELRVSAELAAQRVRETHQPFRFNPMSPRERRIVHLAMKDEPGVRTTSEGRGDERRVVLFPAEAKAK
jgi:spoIIIJ-associated protein